MNIDNKEIRAKVAEHAAKRTGDGPWQMICEGMDEDMGKKCRGAIDAFGRLENNQLSQVVERFSSDDQLGSRFEEFAKRYEKAYREIERTVEPDTTPDESPTVTPQLEEGDELTAADLASIMSLKSRFLKKPTITVYNEYEKMILSWSGEKSNRAFEALGPEAYSVLLALKETRDKRMADLASAKAAISAKIPRSVIETEREEEGWEIEVEVFYPITVGIITGRLGMVAEAIHAFGFGLAGRALPELTVVATMLVLEKYEGDQNKMLTYYSATVVALTDVGSVYRPEATEARQRLDDLLGMGDVASDMMKKMTDMIIEEGV